MYSFGGIEVYPSVLENGSKAIGTTVLGTVSGVLSLRYLIKSGGPHELNNSESHEGWPEITSLTTGMSVIASALSFLLVFRLSWSFQRWWEARTLIGTALSELRNLAVIFANHADHSESVNEMDPTKVLREAIIIMKLYCAVLVDEVAKEKKSPQDSSTDHAPDKRIMTAPFNEILSSMSTQALLEKRDTAVEIMIQDMNPRDKQCLGQSRLLHLLASRRRMLLAHAWLTRVISDGFRAGLIEHFEHETALHCQSALLQTFYACDKIKTVPGLPLFLRYLLVLILGAYSLVLYPQYMAYAFVMKLSDEANEHHILNRYIIFYLAYIALVALGILFFITLHLVSNELDDPFGSDASDIPLLALRNSLLLDLDDITSVYQLEQQRHHERIKKQFATQVRTITAHTRLLRTLGPNHHHHPPAPPQEEATSTAPSSPLTPMEVDSSRMTKAAVSTDENNDDIAI